MIFLIKIKTNLTKMELRTSSELEAELFLNSKYHLISPEPYSNFDGFTKPAFEFAANNKIPLISLNWFLLAI